MTGATRRTTDESEWTTDESEKRSGQRMNQRSGGTTDESEWTTEEAEGQRTNQRNGVDNG